MFLAGIVPKYETELICDFAETYHILDWRTLPLTTAAALSVGLRDNSRVKMKLAGVEAGQDTLLLAAIVDRLSLLWWAKTKDAESGRNGGPWREALLFQIHHRRFERKGGSKRSEHIC